MASKLRTYNLDGHAPASPLAFRRLLSWLSIVLLALNVLTSASLPDRIVQQERFASFGGLLGDQSEICLSGNQGSAEQGGIPSPSAHHNGFCVFCLPLMHSAVDVPTAFTLAAAVPLVQTAPSQLGQQQQFLIVGLLTSISPRAPPTV